MIFKDYIELLQWNHFFNENREWFNRTKLWLTTWAKKPQVYVRESEKTDDANTGDDTTTTDGAAEGGETGDL